MVLTEQELEVCVVQPCPQASRVCLQLKQIVPACIHHLQQKTHLQNFVGHAQEGACSFVLCVPMARKRSWRARHQPPAPSSAEAVEPCC